MNASSQKTIKQYLFISAALIFPITSCSKKNTDPTPAPASITVSTIAGSGTAGSADGTGAAASFSDGLKGITIDAAGNIFVADETNFEIRKITPAGEVTTFAGTTITGHKDGKGAVVRFHGPTGIKVDAAGNFYIADGGWIRKLTPDGTVSPVYVSGLSNFKDLAIDATSTNVYLPANDYDSILRFNITNGDGGWAGNGNPGKTDGKGTAASFNAPYGITIDNNGNLFVTDRGNNLIRKITLDATVSTIAGSGTAGLANGVGNAASFKNPAGIVVDGSGNLYVADTDNNLIRKITPNGTVSTFAGTGASGHTDGDISTATFTSPQNLALDAAGNIYVTEKYKIRKITIK